MHRKIVVIDDRIAFVGGINYSAEHMSDYGPQAKQDYAVRVEGPVVADILQFEVENLPGKAPRAAGGSAIIRLKKIATPAKRRRCLSGGIMKNTATISNVII